MMQQIEWIGHGEIAAALERAMSHGRLAHACIFDGQAGIGKGTMARWAASWLFCQNGEGRPCGRCPSCVKLDTGNHPDLLIICPEEGSIKNQQMEAFQEFLQVKPYLGAHKVIVVEDADTMTVSAQNRILKVLEEPPVGAHIFLLTTRFNRLVPTILSRCQIIRFPDLPAGGIASYLANHYNIDRPRADYLAERAAGSLGRALALMQDDALDQSEPLIKSLLEGFRKKDLMGLLTVLDQHEGKTEWEPVLEWLVYEGNQQMRAAVAQKDEAAVLRWVRFCQHVEDCLRALREQANERIALDVMILRLLEGSDD